MKSAQKNIMKNIMKKFKKKKEVCILSKTKSRVKKRDFHTCNYSCLVNKVKNTKANNLEYIHCYHILWTQASCIPTVYV